MSYQPGSDPASEFINRVRQEWRRRSGQRPGGGGGGNRGALGLIGVIFLIILAFTSFYTVQPDEEAVVLRFGQYSSTRGPGLQFKIPFGIDQVEKLRTRELKQEEFGFRTIDTSGSRTRYLEKGFELESLVLTGDLNVADVSWVVQYRISDPQKYLFNAKDPVRNIRDASMGLMRRVVGDRSLNDVLNIARAEIALQAQTGIQEVLDLYDIGIKIEGVKLQDVVPPGPVQNSFNEVNAAKQEQEALINEAEKKYNSVIPKARGEAEQKIAEAEGHAIAVINRAQGDADKFNSILKSYRLAPAITRKRIYLETMEGLLKNFKQVTIVDNEIKGLLPIYQNKGESK